MLTTICPHCQQTLGLSVMPLSVQQAAFALDPKMPREVIEGICASRSVPVEEVMSQRRHRVTVAARRACIEELSRRWPAGGSYWIAKQLHISYETVQSYLMRKKRGAA